MFSKLSLLKFFLGVAILFVFLLVLLFLVKPRIVLNKGAVSGNGSEAKDPAPSFHTENFNSSSVWHTYFAPNNEIPRLGDFNDDGYDDIITFLSDAGGDVYVALNNGGTGFQISQKWSDWFAPNDEIPLVGDFDGDHFKDDIITFTSDGNGDVWVALGNGSSFGTSTKWHNWFAPNDEIPAVGDFNNDGYDDIVTFVSDSYGDVWVALNNGGTGFTGASVWHDWFAPNDEIPAVGDFNNDGYDDIITFVSDSYGDVWVALNNGGTGFTGASIWNGWFAPNDEIPDIGDFNDDGYDDIVTFVSDSGGDVYVAFSNESNAFVNSAKWHDWFAPNDEIPAVGDFDNDMFSDDIITFTSDSNADVWVALNSADPEALEYNFHVVSDVHQYAGASYDTTNYFRGIAERIAADDSSLLLECGDLGPVNDGIGWTVDNYIGADYDWYPAMGNHEFPGNGVENYYGENMDILRAFDYGTVNPGPATCPETTHSFNFQNAHFITINEYCNDVSDLGTDGDITDTVYNWLVSDLAANTKEHIFVYGHEPAYPQADRENGAQGHMDDSLNKYVSNRDRFWQLLSDNNAEIFFAGHTHTYSSYLFNGVWQIQTGHSQGINSLGTKSTYVKVRVHNSIVYFEAYRRNVTTGVYEMKDRYRVN